MSAVCGWLRARHFGAACHGDSEGTVRYPGLRERSAPALTRGKWRGPGGMATLTN